MTEIQAGPYELTRESNGNGTYDKRTFCLMTDNSISLRQYNKYGNVMTQSEKQCPDLSDALTKMQTMMDDLRKKQYSQKGAPKSKAPAAPRKAPKLGKRARSVSSDSDSESEDEPPKKRQKATAGKSVGKAVKKDKRDVEKKRDQKDEEKKEPERVSKRLEGKEKAVYNEAEIERLREENNEGTGCINVMLAHNYDPEKHDPTGWLMSEKLDGVRCYWNGTSMFTRNGNPFYAPKEWKDKLPKMALDGELWTGRDDFQKIVSIVRKHDTENPEWAKIKFMVFDAPLVKGNFKKRLAVCQAELDKSPNDVVKLCKQTVCKTKEQMEKLMDEICQGKGEGVMVKDPKSQYEGRRSFSLLKVKRFEDAEAKVIGHHKGTGRCHNMLGAIQCIEKDGTEFKIGSGFDDAQRRKPPKIGSTVTFKFQGRSNAGKPRFPIFIRLHPGM